MHVINCCLLAMAKNELRSDFLLSVPLISKHIMHSYLSVLAVHHTYVCSIVTPTENHCWISSFTELGKGRLMLFTDP